MVELFNSDFAKLISVLLALIALFYIGMKHRPVNGTSKSIHLWYISGISIFLIVELITCIVVNNIDAQNIMNYISFASTLSSMILSVLAIFIIAASNESLNKVKDVLIDLPSEVKEKIDVSLNEMKNTATNVESLSSSYNDSQQKTIEKIQELLDNLDNHIQQEFHKNSQKIDDMGEKLTNLSKTASINSNEDEFEPDEKFVKTVLNNTSYLSLQLIYAFDLYREKAINQPLSLVALLKCFDQKEELKMYLFACLVLLSSMKLLIFRQVSDDDFDTIMVGGINPVLLKLFRPYFTSTDNYSFTKSNLMEYFKLLNKSTQDEDQPNK